MFSITIVLYFRPETDFPYTLPSDLSVRLCLLVQLFYISDQKLTFPTHYPVACLLGCVDLVDCLPQDEYRQQVFI